MKFREEAPAKKNTIPLARNAKVSQKDSKEPDSTSFGEISNLLVAEPYSPNTATATTPTARRHAFKVYPYYQLKMSRLIVQCPEGLNRITMSAGIVKL